VPLLPAPLGEVVLLLEPLPLLGDVVLGEVVLGEVVLLPDVPPVLELPVAPLLLPVEPLVMPSSFRHFSRSAPTMPRHLLLVPPAALPVLPGAPGEDAPLEALPEELLPEALGVDEELLGVDDEELLGVDDEELLGVELLEPEALGVELLLLPDALGVELVPLLCAKDTLDSAKSAAAVAAVMSFRVILVLPPYFLLSVLLPAPLLPLPDDELLGELVLGELVLGELVLGELLLGELLLGELLVPPLDDDPLLEAPDLLK
jgi:hypothetical protein